MTRPIKKVLNRLDGAKESGKGWQAKCPAHEDHVASLSASEGNDGKVLLKCHAGCSFEEVVSALGLAPQDLFPKSNGRTNGRREIVATYPYHDRHGKTLFEVVRFRPKGFAQRVPGKGWGRSKHGVDPVLYRLPTVLEAAGEGRVVFVVEGEKDVHTLERWGFAATCNPQGAGSWQESYSEFLKGARVVILPDSGEEGREHAREVARSALGYARSVQIVELPGVPEKGDVTDWKEQGGTAKELRQLVKETPALEEPPKLKAEAKEAKDEEAQHTSYVPFPVDALPAPAADYVSACAKAVGCAPAMTALPLLSAMSAAVGSAARLRLKRSWREPAPLWTMLVAPSGSAKSPALKHALRPVYRREREAKERYERELRAYEKAKKKGEEPQEPKRRRYRTGDATPESVMKLLGENPRGLLLARNELAAWLGSFDRYAQGASDLQFWIEVWDGQQASRDRVTENVTVDRPAVSVTGTIQPGALKEKLTQLHFESGFAARFFLCMPPTRPLQWTEADVTKEVEHAFERLLDGLYSTPRGTDVALTPEAKKLWVGFYNRANEEAARLEGPAKAAYIKGISYGARLALILHLAKVQQVQSATGEIEPISGETMRRGLILAKWLRDETLRVYELLGLAEEVLSPQQRFLRKLPEEFKTKEAEVLAEEEGIPRSTMFDWLKKLIEAGDLEKVRRGLYRNASSVGLWTNRTNLHKDDAASGTNVKKSPESPKSNVGDAAEPLDLAPASRNNGSEDTSTLAETGAKTRPLRQTLPHQESGADRPFEKGQRVRTPKGPGRVVKLDGSKVCVELDSARIGQTETFSFEEVRPKDIN